MNYTTEDDLYGQEEDDHIVDDDIYYMVIYPCGDRSRVTVAQMCYGTWYEENDYDLVFSQERYSTPNQADKAAKRFADYQDLKFEPYDH